MNNEFFQTLISELKYVQHLSILYYVDPRTRFDFMKMEN